MKIKILAFALISVILFSTSSCAEKVVTNTEYYGGESMNAEILSHISESIFNEMTSAAEETSSENTDEISSDNHDGIYYWTDGGSVYHKWADCGHIKNSQDVKSGSRDEAILSGKEKLCSSCEKKN